MPGSWTLLCLMPPGNVQAGYVAWAGARFSSGGPCGALALPPLAPIAWTKEKTGRKDAVRITRALAASIPATAGAFVPGEARSHGPWLFQELGGPYGGLAGSAAELAGWEALPSPPFPPCQGIFLGEAPGAEERLPPLPAQAFMAADLVMLRILLAAPGLSAAVWRELSRARRLKGKSRVGKRAAL